MKQRELTIYKAILYFIIHQLFADVKADYDTISTKKHFDRFFNISLAIRDIKDQHSFILVLGIFSFPSSYYLIQLLLEEKNENA